jgi:thiamine kinase-like enzyme
MRFIKLALISVVVLFGLITLISLLLPSHIRISRAIDIYAASEKVYLQVADIRQWDKWNEYIRAYHNKKFEGSRLKTDEIIVIISGKTDSLVTSVWQQPSGNKFESGFTVIAQDGSHTILQWYFDFHLKWYPWEKFQSIIYDQQFGPVMEKSLTNLKKIVENSN